MNKFFWHIDMALLRAVAKPLAVMGIVFAALTVTIVVLVVLSLKKSK